MAAVHATVLHVSEAARRSRRAGGRKAGGGDRRPPQSEFRASARSPIWTRVPGKTCQPCRRCKWTPARPRSNQAAHLTGVRDRRGPSGRTWHASGAWATPENPSPDRDRGVAEGVAHAPDASFIAGDSRAHSDTGGRKRRPPPGAEVAHWPDHRRSDAPHKSFWRRRAL